MRNNEHPSERRIQALALSRGFGIGPVRFVDDRQRRPPTITLAAEAVEPEVVRFRSAVETTASQLKDLTPSVDAGAGEPVAHILGVQLLMIEGSPLTSRVESLIRERRVNAEWALEMVADEQVVLQSSVSDSHIREKRVDIEDVVSRLLLALNENGSSARDPGVAGSVVVSHELRPSMVLELAKQRPAAFVTERGGWTSHSSIVAREFHIPMVSGVRDVRATFAGVDRAMVDGVAGTVILHPGPHTLDHVGAVSALVPGPSAVSSGPSPVRTVDGVRIVIRANVDNIASYPEAMSLGAHGIGLFRSESLVKHGRFPTEDEQFTVYAKAAAAVWPAGVRIRTFDLSADEQRDDAVERNPALGLRSLRLSLSEKTQFCIQIRAILRAAVGRKVDIVLPMVAGSADIVRAKLLIDEQKADLEKRGLKTGDPRLGAMIELPSAVLTIDSIAERVDFLCLGTNDLVQYLLGVDRDNEAVAEWYESLHPAVIHAVADVIAAGVRHRVPVQICGEMAGSPFYVPLMIGLGSRELSMNLNSVTAVRRLISGISQKACVDLAQRIADCQTASEAERLLRDQYRAEWSDLFPAWLLDLKHR